MEKSQDPDKKLWLPADIEAKLKDFDEKIENAKSEDNTSLVSADTLKVEKGIFLKDKAKDFDRAEEVLGDALLTAVGPNGKLEIYFEILQMTISKLEIQSVKKDIEICNELVNNGGDWEKKNKLKVYNGVVAIMTGEYKKASDYFLDSVATFSCSEFIDFGLFIFYTVLSSLVSQDRATLKAKVVHNPEILSVIGDIPNLKAYLESFFRCDYKTFYLNFCEVSDRIKKDKYFQLNKNYLFYIKEMRLVAYKQFLESYKSVTIKSMAYNFGVSIEFIDKELSAFIAAGKLACVIDKVEGVIESTRGDKRVEAQYQKMIKKGDGLLNRMQKLGRALDVGNQ